MPLVVIPAIAILVIALLAVLLLLAAEQFGKALAAIMPGFHIPGLGSIRSWITTHISEAISSVTSYLDGYVHPLSVFIASHFTVFKTILSLISDLALDTHSALYGLATHTVPMALSHAKQFAAGLVSAAEAKALSLYHLSLTYAHDLVNYALGLAMAQIAYAEAQALIHYHQSLTYAHDLVNYALNTALSSIAALDAKAVGLYHLSLTYAHDLAAAVESNAVALFKSASLTIESRYQQALTFAAGAAKAESTAVLNGLNSALVTDIEHAWPLVVTGIEGVIDVAGVDFPDVVADLRGIARSLPRDLPAAIAMSTAIAIPLLRLAKDCTMPNCRNLSQVGRDLQELFGLLETGGLLLLVGEAAHNPSSVAHDIVSVLHPIVVDMQSFAKSILGA
jgi:hypothetical protein